MRKLILYCNDPYIKELAKILNRESENEIVAIDLAQTLKKNGDLGDLEKIKREIKNYEKIIFSVTERWDLFIPLIEYAKNMSYPREIYIYSTFIQDSDFSKKLFEIDDDFDVELLPIQTGSQKDKIAEKINSPAFS